MASEEKTVDSEAASRAAIVQLPDERPRQPMLSDSYGLVRVCSTRSQRIVPTHGGNAGKGLGRTAAMQRQLLHLAKCLLTIGEHLSASPFRPAAQCDYYVIMLRRIIR